MGILRVSSFSLPRWFNFLQICFCSLISIIQLVYYFEFFSALSSFNTLFYRNHVHLHLILYCSGPNIFIVVVYILLKTQSSFNFAIFTPHLWAHWIEQVILFCEDNENKTKLIPGHGYCLCGVCMVSLGLCGFFLGTRVSIHIPKIRTWGEQAHQKCPSQWEWVWVALRWKEILSRFRSRIVPWATGMGSGHLWSWTGKRERKITLVFINLS